MNPNNATNNDIKKDLADLLKLPEGMAIKKIQGEASTRCFFRVPSGPSGRQSLVAMVYPEKNEKSTTEIANIIRLTDTYRNHGLNVPEIKEVFDDRVLLQEDLGDMLFQKAYADARLAGRERLLEQTADIVVALTGIPTTNTSALLAEDRLKWEMDFFVSHFARNDWPDQLDFEAIRARLHALVDAIGPFDTFAHRDFHSRNMLVYKEKIYLVDYQDSLKTSLYYDTVSFAFDAYLDLKSQRAFFLEALRKRGLDIGAGSHREEQYYLAALQRNIKALGTFGFQVNQRRNLVYKKYIPRTLRHILNNPQLPKFLAPQLFQ